MNTILEKTQELKTSILRFGASARAVVREVCTFEFLGLATMLLPALMASIGFFFDNHPHILWDDNAKEISREQRLTFVP